MTQLSPLATFLRAFGISRYSRDLWTRMRFLLAPLEACRRDCDERPSRERTCGFREETSCPYIGVAAAASLLGIFGTLSAAPAPTPNLPNVPEVYKLDPGWPKPLPG